MRLQFWWSGQFGGSLYCYYFQVHSEMECSYLLWSLLWTKYYYYYYYYYMDLINPFKNYLYSIGLCVKKTLRNSYTIEFGKLSKSVLSCVTSWVGFRNSPNSIWCYEQDSNQWGNIPLDFKSKKYKYEHIMNTIP